jgi:hypothetical protein
MSLDDLVSQRLVVCSYIRRLDDARTIHQLGQYPRGRRMGNHE